MPIALGAATLHTWHGEELKNIRAIACILKESLCRQKHRHRNTDSKKGPRRKNIPTGNQSETTKIRCRSRRSRIGNHTTGRRHEHQNGGRGVC